MRLRESAIVCLLAATSACTTVRYYAHVTHGQLALLAGREPVAEVVADPRRDARLRERLAQAQQARAFASDRLGLPHNRSYTSYVELGRPYVTWNVFATAEFSVEPLTHCFPFAGCVAYLGYFERARAEREAARLRGRGDDVSVEGAAAYSTLGWFADPILSSMLRWSDEELDGTIFHELAHQRIYVGNDTAFNESYASFVQQQGLREWRAARGLAEPDAREAERDAAFTLLVLDLRERLKGLYASERPEAELRRAKQDEFAAFRERYARIRDSQWDGSRRYDAWVAAPLNNASLVPFGLYETWIPAFARLFREAGGQWPQFHRRVRALADLPRAERDAELARLAAER
jgi:predicted aminopeptidase